MTNEEARNLLKAAVKKEENSELKEAMYCAIHALKLNIPMEPELIIDDVISGYKHYECPNCESFLSARSKIKHCECGQTIKWNS